MIHSKTNSKVQKWPAAIHFVLQFQHHCFNHQPQQILKVATINDRCVCQLSPHVQLVHWPIRCFGHNKAPGHRVVKAIVHGLLWLHQAGTITQDAASGQRFGWGKLVGSVGTNSIKKHGKMYENLVKSPLLKIHPTVDSISMYVFSIGQKDGSKLGQNSSHPGENREMLQSYVDSCVM